MAAQPNRRTSRFQRWDRITIFGRRWFWRFKNRNGETMMNGEAFNSAAARDNSIDSIVEDIKSGNYIIEDI